MNRSQPRIAMIAAMAENRIIGANNRMPWHLPADLKHFKSVTLGKPVLMGRLTYESIGRALPGRQNIVISRQKNYKLDDAEVVGSIDDAIQSARGKDEVMIIGGGQLYRALLPYAYRLYLTFIDLEVEGDTQFPDYTQGIEWQTLTEQSCYADEKNPYDYKFVCLERTSPLSA
jgi:dihydrofolate reductase